MSMVDDYILQYFKAKDSGNPETPDAYRARQCWIKHDYPSLNKVDELCNLKKGMGKYYSQKYGWTNIRCEIEKLQAEQDLIERRERQNKVENKHRNRHEILGNAFEKRITELLVKLGEIPKEGYEPPELTEPQRSFLWSQIIDLRKELSAIQKDERTTEHLPNNYKDLTADLKLKAETTNTNLNFNMKTTAEVLDENADTIERFIERRMHKSDKSAN